MLFGYAEVINRNKHLNVSYQLNYREKTESCINRRLSAGKIRNDRSSGTFADRLRDAANIFIAISYFSYPRRKRYRVNALNNAARHIAVSSRCKIAVRGHIVGCAAGERPDVSVAAVKNDLFAERGNTLNLKRAAVRRHIKVEVEQEEECQVAGIKSFVKGNLFNADVCFKYLCRTQAYTYSLFNKALNVLGEETPQILKAVTIATPNTLYTAKHPCIQAG